MKDEIPLISCLLETSVPENWIPLMPVSADATRRAVKLPRLAMERLTKNGVTGKDEVVDVLPLGRILSSVSTRTIEAELPREGLRITRKYNRSRWNWAGSALSDPRTARAHDDGHRRGQTLHAPLRSATLAR